MDENTLLASQTGKVAVFYFARTKLNSEKEGVGWQESLGDGDSYLQGGTLYHVAYQGVAVMRRNRACRSQFSFQLNFAGPLFFPRQDSTVPAVSGARQKGTWGAINILLVH